MPHTAAPTKAKVRSSANANGTNAAAIQPISRALRLLEVLNQRQLSTIDELHRDTGYPKPSLVRLLNALIADDYVSQVSRTAGYRVAERVLSLSSGFRQRDLLVDAGIQPMRRFTAEHKWPLYLATLENFMMHIRFSTADMSPIAPDLSGYNMPFNVLSSAVGRAYIAFCPDKERELILKTLAQSTDDLDLMARDRAAVDTLIEEIRAKGYSVTGSIFGDRGRGIAVPIRLQKRVVGSVSMRHYKTTMTEADAAKRYLGPLQDLADTIAQRMSQPAKNVGAPKGAPRRVRTTRKVAPHR